MAIDDNCKVVYLLLGYVTVIGDRVYKCKNLLRHFGLLKSLYYLQKRAYGLNQPRYLHYGTYLYILM